MIESSVLNKIKDYADSSPEREICGFVVYSEGFVKFKKCKNVSTDNEQFKISPKEFLKTKVESKILYIVHSHISSDSEMSESDKLKSEALGYKFLIYSVKSKTFSYYDPNDTVFPYVGKTFNIGYSDCFSLVRDYYFNEFGIKIKDYSRDKLWKSKTPNLITDNFKNEGFYEIQMEDLCKYDLIIIKDPKFNIPCHIMIYMGKNEILHHPNNSKSMLQIYSEDYQQLSEIFLRHERFS